MKPSDFQHALLGPIVQSLLRLIADPGVMILIPALEVKIMKYFIFVILLLLLIQERSVSVTSENMCT